MSKKQKLGSITVNYNALWLAMEKYNGHTVTNERFCEEHGIAIPTIRGYREETTQRYDADVLMTFMKAVGVRDIGQILVANWDVDFEENPHIAEFLALREE
jgi:hypothetical protein